MSDSIERDKPLGYLRQVADGSVKHGVVTAEIAKSEIARRQAGAAPLPWDWMWVSANASGGGHVYLLDADGRKIGAIWGKAEEKRATADLILNAVRAHTGDA